MSDDAILQRPDGDDFIAHVGSPVSSGTQVVVDSGDMLLLVDGGQVVSSLEAGRGVVPADVAAGVFVRRAARAIRVAQPLQELSDAAGGAASARLFGEARVAVADPVAFLSALEDVTELGGGGLETILEGSITAAVDESLQAALEGGQVDVAGVERQAAAILAAATSRYDVPGVRVDLSGLSISIGPAGAGDDEDEDDEESSVIGASVAVRTDGGSVRGVVEGVGYLVRLESGEATWVAADDVELE